MSVLSEAVLKIKNEHKDPYLVIGGDLNKADLNEAIGDYADMRIIATAPSRSDHHLDIAACSFNEDIIETVLQTPLKCDRSGAYSDHAFLLYHASLQHCHDFTWIKYCARQITDWRIRNTMTIYGVLTRRLLPIFGLAYRHCVRVTLNLIKSDRHSFSL